MKEIKKFEKYLECDCGCTTLRITEYDWDNNDIQISFDFLTNYLSKENGKLKRIINCARDKETYYAEVLVSKEKAINFLEDVLKCLKE